MNNKLIILLNIIFFIIAFLYPSVKENEERNSYHNNLQNLKEAHYRLKLNDSPYNYELSFFSPITLKLYEIIKNEKLQNLLFILIKFFKKSFNEEEFEFLEFLIFKRISIILMIYTVTNLINLLNVSQDRQLIFRFILYFNPFTLQNISENGFVLVEFYCLIKLLIYIKNNNNLIKYILIALSFYQLTKYILLILVFELYYHYKLKELILKTGTVTYFLYYIFRYFYKDFLFKGYYMYYSGSYFVNYEGYQTEIIFNVF